MNNRYFYRAVDYQNPLFMNDPRGYISPYLDAELEGEIENKFYFDRYMRLSNVSKNSLKIRCNGAAYRSY